MAILRGIDGKFYEVPDDQCAAFEVPQDQVKDKLQECSSELPQQPQGGPGGPGGPGGMPPGGLVYVQVFTGGGSGGGGPEGGEIQPHAHCWRNCWRNYCP